MTQIPTPPDRISFGPLDRISIDAVAYTCVETTEAGHRLRRVDDPKMFETVTHAEMAAYEKGAGDKPYRYDRDWFQEGKVKARMRSGVENFADLPLREQPKVQWKWEYCDEFRLMDGKGEVERSNAGMTRAIAKIAVRVNALDCAKIARRIDEKREKGKPVPLNKDGKPRKVRSGTQIVLREPPSYRTLQRWLAILEECDWCIEALRDGYRHCGDRTPQIEPEAYVVMVEKARGYAAQERPSKEKQYERLEIAIKELNDQRVLTSLKALTLPSKRRFYAEIGNLDAFWVYARRHTPEAAARKFAGVDDGPMATRIGERIEMDEWQVSLQKLLIRSGAWEHLSPETRKAVKRARWWLYAAIDRASRVILAMRLVERPCAAEAVATIRMILKDKSALAEAAGATSGWFMHTGLGTVVTDWGSAFRAEETRRVVRSLGGTYTHPAAGNPGMRGTVERMFGTLETRFMPHFVGRTFSNVVQKGDYDAQANADLPLDVIAQLLVRHVVDDYHRRPHRGLGGATPYDAYSSIMKRTGRIPIHDTNTLRAVFGIEETCTLDNSGVEMLGLKYQNKELFEFFTRKGVCDVLVRVDPEDVGFASVKLGEDWVTVPCKQRELRGVPLRTWIQTADELNARFKERAALSRPIVLQTVRAIDEVAAEYKRKAGIVDALDTPEALRAARERLGLGFRLPDWDEEDAGGDLLDGVIPVGAVLDHVPMPEDLPIDEPVEDWRMGDRNEGKS
ncbi:hypothetical protein [Methylobacterium oryzae]|uniref:hypothetical protein n=1 Tax=Methylobacterium oryzae TaxID=334852 RepID=UPI002F2FC218